MKKEKGYLNFNCFNLRIYIIYDLDSDQCWATIIRNEKLQIQISIFRIQQIVYFLHLILFETLLLWYPRRYIV